MPDPTPDRQPWEIWFERYRGSELAELVLHLTREVLAKGRVTAEDGHGVRVVNTSVRGAAMRILRRRGILRKVAPAAATTESSHGHTLWEWELASALEAQRLLRTFQCATLHTPPTTVGQLLLAV